MGSRWCSSQYEAIQNAWLRFFCPKTCENHHIKLRIVATFKNCEIFSTYFIFFTVLMFNRSIYFTLISHLIDFTHMWSKRTKKHTQYKCFNNPVLQTINHELTMPHTTKYFTKLLPVRNISQSTESQFQSPKLFRREVLLFDAQIAHYSKFFYSYFLLLFLTYLLIYLNSQTNA